MPVGYPALGRLLQEKVSSNTLWNDAVAGALESLGFCAGQALVPASVGTWVVRGSWVLTRGHMVGVMRGSAIRPKSLCAVVAEMHQRR
jgi:hypothetical protein